MVLHITQQQEGSIRNLVRRRCANYADGNCLLLDGLEERTCVQLLCSSGIYCRYFQNAVLPIEKDLYTQILKQNSKEGCFRWRIKSIHRHFTRKSLSHSVVKR